MIDGLYDLRAQRLAIEKQVTELKLRETATKEEILSILNEQGLNGAKGLTATAAITHKTVPLVTDWEQVYAFIRDQDMFALLQKRLTVTLWSALAEDGVAVPGTEPQVVTDLSLTRSTR
jgi:hypothetical protein